MTFAERMASFVTRTLPQDLSSVAIEQLKIRILDALGCAIAAMNADPMKLLRRHTAEFGGSSRCTIIGGGKTAPDRAAFFNGALVRYLDFNDSFLAPGETCHPSDNLAPVLAAAEDAGRNGRDFLTALAIAYQVQCRLSEAAPVRAKGFDHTTQGAYAVAAGVSKALGLTQDQTACALAIAGTTSNALRVTRTGRLSQWKGLAYPHTAFCATHGAYLARQGVTGPLEVFEGNKGFMDAISGKFDIAWEHENLEKVTQTIVKKFNAEIHSQSAIEAILELKSKRPFAVAEVRRVDLETFDVAFHIIGGGEEGDKKNVATKEQADHSLPYLLAVAILDGQVMPEQFSPERIRLSDVQELLGKVHVRAAAKFSRRFPQEMACRITVGLADGSARSLEARDYDGFVTRPMNWNGITGKFDRLTPELDATLKAEIIQAVSTISQLEVSDLTQLLAKAGS
jgi:2-methylcitrate dehydratase